MGDVEPFLYSSTLTKSAAGKSLRDLRSCPLSPCHFLLFFVNPRNLNTELYLSNGCVARTLTIKEYQCGKIKTPRQRLI